MEEIIDEAVETYGILRKALLAFKLYKQYK